MRYLLLLICSSFLFTGCFTWNTLDSAKEDRRPERVKTVLSSYKDTSGNAVVVYKKRYRKAVYKAVVPLDTILSEYKASYKDDLYHHDSTIANFRGVFTNRDADNKKEEQRIILFNKETPLADTGDLHKEIEKNEQLVQNHKGKMRIPVEGYSLAKERVTTRPVTFVVPGGSKEDSVVKTEKYYIVFQPKRRKYVRYLLVPFTIGLDAVSWPAQLVIGFIQLSKVPLS